MSVATEVYEFFIQDIVSTYEQKIRKLEELKEAICVDVAQIERAMLKRVFSNFVECHKFKPVCIFFLKQKYKF